MPVIELILPDNMGEIIKAGKYAAMIKLLNTPYPNEAAARFEMLKMLTGMNGYDLGVQLGAGNTKGRKRLAENISDEDAMEIIEQVFPALDFIFGNEKFYINPFPQFEHKGITYAGPSSGRLSDQTGEEWMVSHQQHFLYTATAEEGAEPDIQYLRMVVAANYHRVLDGKRTSFSEETLVEDAEAFKDLPEEIIKGIVVWYNHANAWWAENFEWLFGGEEKDTAQQADGKEIRHLLFELSGNKLDSAWDVLCKRSRQDIVYALDRLEKRREEMEEAAEERDK
jgi:hypothetical protein